MSNKLHNEQHEQLHDRTPALTQENIKLRQQVIRLESHLAELREAAKAGRAMSDVTEPPPCERCWTLEERIAELESQLAEFRKAATDAIAAMTELSDAATSDDNELISDIWGQITRAFTWIRVLLVLASQAKLRHTLTESEAGDD